MDIRKIKKMIELLEESGIAEIEIKEGEESLRIARVLPGQPTTTYLATPMQPPQITAAPPVAAAAEAAPADPAGKASGPLRAGVGEHIVTAPMVGTFHASGDLGWMRFAKPMWGFLAERLDHRIAVSERARARSSSGTRTS